MKLSNPLGFTPGPVTIIASAAYIALTVVLLYVHHYLPVAPGELDGLVLDEAWRDLQHLTRKFHPYNSHENDNVRAWLLTRISEIIHDDEDKPEHESIKSNEQVERHAMAHANNQRPMRAANRAMTVVVPDQHTNISFGVAANDRRDAYSAYFESTNIIVYIRGIDDDPSDWWRSSKEPKDPQGVLVNAHYDSVSTGYGASDDGIGVVTILQLIKYFSTPGNQPRHGIVALLNNGEEDDLYGARAFSRHPISKFTKTFLNLEGAGAGGRAVLFRSTDTEITRAYQNVKYPFGTVVNADAFKRRLIKSETDYTIFSSWIDMRGLDVAFMAPRARYHTNEDDTRHTDRDSMYHMMSAALGTMKDLANRVQSNAQDPTSAVWFDLFGRLFAVFQLHTLFALEITLLVVSPLILLLVGISLRRHDRAYLFSGSKPLPQEAHHSDDAVSIKGRRGLFRWPLTFVLASAAVAALAFLLTMLNPFIIYSSPYAVWSMMISAFLFVSWVCLRAIDYVRPTALHRQFSFLWIFAAAWVIMVVAVVFQQKEDVGSPYLVFFQLAGTFLATVISLLELYGLPPKTTFAEEVHEDDETNAEVSRRSAEDHESDEEAEVDGDGGPDESSSLIGASRARKSTFRKRRARGRADPSNDEPATLEETLQAKSYGSEQPWSHALPSSLWILEFLLMVPIPFILWGQVALITSSSLPQTLADGSNALFIYAIFGVLTIILFAPLGPFLHRFSWLLGLSFFLVLGGTVVYNLFAFPFSPNNRFKIYFQQQIDLNTGAINTTYTGSSLQGYLQRAVDTLPSAADVDYECEQNARRAGLATCRFSGLAPRVTSPLPTRYSNTSYNSWIKFDISRVSNTSTRASFSVSGKDTRSCKIHFDHPIVDFHVSGSGAQDDRLAKIGEKSGSHDLKLWSRTWNRSWQGTFDWAPQQGYESSKSGARQDSKMSGRVACLWSDANIPGRIPALDEAWRFAPSWVAITKLDDGLVEGSKSFSI